MASLSLVPSLFLAPTTKAVTRSCYTKHGAHSPSCSKISCSAGDNDDKLGRRDMVMGLGGLYGVAGLPAAMASPIRAPDLYSAREIPDALPCGVKVGCKAPPANFVDFKPSQHNSWTTLRVRPAAHMASPEFVAKYEEALRRMKALPDDDPRSFSQQAKIHCAYCNGGYRQLYNDKDIQVHFNWLFFPFHRWYLYFYERILGSLIDDPTFAIPFWNWDATDGMTMPAMFTNNTDSPLYDKFRSKAHQPPYVLDLDYDYKHKDKNVTKPDEEQKRLNLCTMYRQMVSGARNPDLFFGAKYSAGDQPTTDKGLTAGTIENKPHTAIHVLCGSEKPNPGEEGPQHGEDMGNFYSAGWDPIFYALHGNVDRMWSLWRAAEDFLPKEERRKGRREDPKDPDWLDASLMFYDENKQLVRVKVRDCLHTQSLGYVYDNVPIEWSKSKPKSARAPTKPRLLGSRRLKHGRALSEFPLTLEDSPVTVMVPRPKKGRSKEEKEEEEEVLVITGIDFDHNVAVKFDVYINDEEEDGTKGPDFSEYAGSFGNVPHMSGNKYGKLSLKLAISDLIDDLAGNEDDDIAVTLFPRTRDLITIGGIKIEFIS